MKKLILSVIILIIIAACKKESDSENPVVTITAPTSNSMFGIGDSILITFTAIDADMHSYALQVLNTADSTIIFEADAHTHGNVTYSQKFKSPDVATNMDLIVTGEDHNGNSATQTVNFHTM